MQFKLVYFCIDIELALKKPQSNIFVFYYILHILAINTIHQLNKITGKTEKNREKQKHIVNQ